MNGHHVEYAPMRGTIRIHEGDLMNAAEYGRDLITDIAPHMDGKHPAHPPEMVEPHHMVTTTQRTVDVLNTTRMDLLKADPDTYYKTYPIPRFSFDQHQPHNPPGEPND